MSSQKSRVEESFAAPSFREYQKESMEHILDGIRNPDTDVVIYNAPTGSGKSLVLEGVANAADGRAFYTTPLNSLVDQLEDDEFMGDRVITLKGRNNYLCVHPEDEGKSVDKAICQRDSNFECDIKKTKCPYYSTKYNALSHPEVVTNISYIMAEGMIPDEVEDKFEDRYVLEIDECQGIEDFAMNFISFTVSERNVPDDVWEGIRIPDDDKEDDMEFLIEWLKDEVLKHVNNMMEYLNEQSLMSEGQSEDYEKLREFSLRVQNFLDDISDNAWVANIETDFRKNKRNKRKVVFQPIYIGRFLDNLLWSRGENIVLSSATVPGGSWLSEIGLGDANIKRINVPSTFPVDNRPIIFDHDVGKMTYNQREKNSWPMAKKILQLSEYHKRKDEPNGFVHCRSYKIRDMLERAYKNHDEAEVSLPDGDGGLVKETFNTKEWVKENVMLQDRYNREDSLQNWIDSDTPVFFSVAMDEGVDLEGDKCRWQALAKVLYPSMKDKRVSVRMDKMCESCGELKWDANGDDCPDCGKSLGDWSWYNRKAVIQIQQAYGRGVRSPEDECCMYMLDSSARNLVKMNAEMFQSWFLEAIQDMKVDPSRGL